MIDPELFCVELERRGFDFFSGVPCSFLQGAFSRLETRSGYVPAPHEGVALSMAAGAQMAGGRSAVLAQNSGLGNLLDPLTSLLMSYDIGVLVVMSLRGWPDPADDEPHHEVMGRSTAALFAAIGVEHGTLGPEPADLTALLDRADAAHREGRSFALLVPRDTIGSCARREPQAGVLDRATAVRALAGHLDSALVYATTGMISRELFGVDDRPEHFYMQGSMGHAIGLALGTATARPDRRVVVLDGDGSAVMHLGGMALAGERAPANLTHVVLDNASYDSTGGQRVRDSPLAWDRLAPALGYRGAVECRTVEEIDSAMSAAGAEPGPHLVAVHMAPGGAPPPRVTSRHTNRQVAERFARAASARAVEVG